LLIINWMKKVLFKTLVIFLFLLIALVIAGFGINIHMLKYSNKYIASDTDGLKQLAGDDIQVAIILGAYVYDNGQPCPMLVDRLLTGIAVYNEQLTGTILLSGDHGTRGYDEVNAMKIYVFNKDIPKEDVFLDHAGFSTYDSIIRSLKIFEVEKAVISTQEYHLARAVYIARKSGIKAYGIKADLRNYPKSEMSRYIVREWLARIKDFLYINVFKPDPVFLGDKIPITGSSDASYDKPDDMQ